MILIQTTEQCRFCKHYAIDHAEFFTHSLEVYGKLFSEHGALGKCFFINRNSEKCICKLFGSINNLKYLNYKYEESLK